VDLLTSTPPLLGLAASGGGRLLGVVRILRLLRVFRILGLGSYVREATLLRQALIASRRKILVFLLNHGHPGGDHRHPDDRYRG